MEAAIYHCGGCGLPYSTTSEDGPTKAMCPRCNHRSPNTPITIWKEAEAAHIAARDAMLAHLRDCSKCGGHYEYCTDGQALIVDFASTGKFPAGLDVIAQKQCPVHAQSGMGCMFCVFGHMTECHYPQRCDEAQCSHLERYA